MALTKPFLLSIPAFDANIDNVIKFEVYGGDQIVGNTLKIINNKTGAEVYNKFQESYAMKHTIPKNLLKNNTYYSATIQTKNEKNELSTWSNNIDFYCYTTPTIKITNIPNDEIIRNFSFNFEIEYNQIEGELLNSYKFILYDSSKVKIFSTEILYVGEVTSLPLVLYYNFSGLETNKIYEAEITGETINRTTVVSPKYRFKVNYVKPNSYALLYLNNNCNGGYIDVESNIIDITGKTPHEPIYINKEEIDVRDSYVLWDEGFSIDDDFILKIWGSHFKDDSTIVEMADLNFNYNIKLIYRKDRDKHYIEANVYKKNKLLGYCIYSNEITVAVDDEIFIWFKRIGNIYDLKIESKVKD